MRALSLLATSNPFSRHCCAVSFFVVGSTSPEAWSCDMSVLRMGRGALISDEEEVKGREGEERAEGEEGEEVGRGGEGGGGRDMRGEGEGEAERENWPILLKVGVQCCFMNCTSGRG